MRESWEITLKLKLLELPGVWWLCKRPLYQINKRYPAGTIFRNIMSLQVENFHFYLSKKIATDLFVPTIFFFGICLSLLHIPFSEHSRLNVNYAAVEWQCQGYWNVTFFLWCHCYFIFQMPVNIKFIPVIEIPMKLFAIQISSFRCLWKDFAAHNLNPAPISSDKDNNCWFYSNCYQTVIVFIAMLCTNTCFKTSSEISIKYYFTLSAQSHVNEC